MKSKYTNEQYRKLALRQFGTSDLTVSSWGAVHPCADGAYVEMTAWVPNPMEMYVCPSETSNATSAASDKNESSGT